MFAGRLCSGALVILTQWVAAACLALLLAVMMAPLLVWSAQGALHTHSRVPTAAKQAKAIQAKAPEQANGAGPALLPPPHGFQASSCAGEACGLTTTTTTTTTTPSAAATAAASDCGKWYCPNKATSFAKQEQVKEGTCMEKPNSSETVDKSRRRISRWYTTIVQR
jgi:hypothetical protein